MSESAFAAAARAAAGTSQVSDTNGDAVESFAGQQSQLFGGQVLPSSLMNKTHGLGSERKGKISQAPYDVHARDFNTKQPKYFLKTPELNEKGRMVKVGSRAIDPATGEKNDPVKDTVVMVDTEYRFDTAECMAIGRDPSLPDDGRRAFYASGEDLKQLRSEIARLKLQSGDEMIGLTLTVARTGQKPNPGGNPSWITKITLSR